MNTRQRFWKAVHALASQKTQQGGDVRQRLEALAGPTDDPRIWRQVYDLASKNILNDRDIRHYMPSLIYSPEDMCTSDFLVDVSTAAVRTAWKEPLACGKSDLVDSQYLNIFPGEHYRLLSGLAKTMQPAVAVEIGTWTGMGTLSLAGGMPDSGTVFSFDIVEWDQMPLPTHFEGSDFANGRIQQVIGDLTDDAVFGANQETLESAELIFMDAPKDGEFEYKMLDQFKKLAPKDGKLLVLDDIRFINMIDLWRSIASPKLDLSSFGHWSGTGLVDISQGLRVH